MHTDQRYITLKRGLCQLNDNQLRTIIKFSQDGGEILCDTYNYDVKLKLWCPLAIGLGMHKKDFSNINLTNEIAKELIVNEGEKYYSNFSLNPIKGVPGSFFKKERLSDLLTVCENILINRCRRESFICG